MPASLSFSIVNVFLEFKIILEERVFERVDFFVKNPSSMSCSLLVGRPTMVRVSYYNYSSVMSLTVVVIFRVSAVHVVSVACQGAERP